MHQLYLFVHACTVTVLVSALLFDMQYKLHTYTVGGLCISTIWNYFSGAYI